MVGLNAVAATFSASIKSVGTAVTMSSLGFYLHHRKFLSKEGKRSLALMSQQVTFPLYFFTKIIYCNQDWSDKPCPDVTSTLGSTWMLLLWPCYMVGTGLLVGRCVARLTNTPKHQVPSVLAATAFANNTALPITLLAVVRANFPSTSDLGRIDPALFLSVYLVVYPILQWSLGGWILAPSDEDDDTFKLEAEEDPLLAPRSSSLGDSIRRIVATMQQTASGRRYRRNVVNNKDIVQARNQRTCGLTSNDESNYMTELDLEHLVHGRHSDHTQKNTLHADYRNDEDFDDYGTRSLSDSSPAGPLLEDDGMEPDPTEVFVMLKKNSSLFGQEEKYHVPNYHATDNNNNNNQQATIGTVDNKQQSRGKFETDSVWETIKNILDRTLFQPPVVGALLGILCAVTPARGYFVDLVTRHSNAPLQWLFDGLYKVGSLAVPDNMLILGCNLSASYNSHISRNGRSTAHQENQNRNDHDLEKSKHELSRNTMLGIVIGKMLVMPVIGISTTYLLEQYVLDIPEEIAGAFYLVLMIVFITPTANNVMIMIELSGCDIAVLEGVANVIALQYVVAPVVLSLTMTIAIGIASGWT